MERPQVSLLIPAYNAASTIERALDSAYAQEGVTLEVCVALNGDAESCAATEQVIRSKARVPFKVATLTGATGPAAALNAAATLASGSYFMELDADDYLEPNALAKLLDAWGRAEAAGGGEIGFVYGQTQYHGDSEMLFTPQPFFREMYWYGNLSLYPFLYRREAWEAGCRYHSLYYDEGLKRQFDLQDWDMGLQLTEFMRYEGLAVPNVLVLHYHYAQSGAHETARPAHAEMLKRFKARWPMVRTNRV